MVENENNISIFDLSGREEDGESCSTPCTECDSRTEETKIKKRIEYCDDLPRRMYTFFAGYSEFGAPSFSKFARSIGITLEELRSFREHSDFDRAWRECNEIRRDYLIDTALAKRADASIVKFILCSEFNMGQEETVDNDITVSLEVIGGEKNED